MAITSKCYTYGTRQRGQNTWLALDGTEVVNNARVGAYLSRYGGTGEGIICPPCTGFSAYIGDGGYSDPVHDPAPWYDPAIPESARLYGFAGFEFRGLGDAAIIDDDGRLYREVELHIDVVAQDRAAMAYGMAWLSRAMKGSVCAGQSCEGSTVCLLAYCPDPRSTPAARYAFDATVTEGPDIESWERKEGNPLVARVSATMTIKGEGWWADPLPGGEVTVAPGRGRRTTVDLLGTYLNCPDPVPCIDDPECERPVLPDLEPAPVDICYPSEPFAGRRSVVRIPASAVPTSLTAVPLITATTGAADLRNLTVRLWINSLDIDCTELADVSPCAVCAEVTVAYVPRGSTLRIDGRTQRAVIECPSAAGVSLEAPTLYGPGGGAYEWPDVSCAYGLCLEVTVDASTDAEASVEIQLPVQWESI